jgi:hypothetical protein
MRNTWLEKVDEKLIERRFAVRLFKLHDDGAVTTWFCKDHCANKNSLGVLIDKPNRVDGYTIYLDGKELFHREFEKPMIMTESYEILILELSLDLLDIIEAKDNNESICCSKDS